MTDNRRTSTRYNVSIEAKLTIAASALTCTMTNLSLGGALVSGTKQPMGQRVQISFRIPTLETPVDVGAVVRWTDAAGVGLQFDGLRAQEVWGLNEYFKQLG